MNPWWPLEQKFLSCTDTLCTLSKFPESDQEAAAAQGTTFTYTARLSSIQSIVSYISITQRSQIKKKKFHSTLERIKATLNSRNMGAIVFSPLNLWSEK